MSLITMSAKEIDRFAVLSNLVDRRINGTEAAEQLHLSVRQVRRIKGCFDKNKPEAIANQSRGRTGNRKLKQVIVKRIINLLTSIYTGFGPTLAAEKLREREQIKVSVETLRMIMVNNKLWKPRCRKKNKEHREWRPRKENYGAMAQYDGSYHHWFEERAEECCLLLAVDDATGKITKAIFDHHEGIAPTFGFWKAYIEETGKPVSVYLDKFSTYKINHKSAQDNKEMITQFQRACQNLNIKLIFAHSPEAKGRVERIFKTLQDRLVKELRLQNISDIETANKFLKQKFIPDFNKKFAVVPEKKTDLHRSLTKINEENMDSIFSKHSNRVVMNDFTIQFNNQYFQLNQQQPVLVCRRDKVLIEEHLNSSIKVKLRGKELIYVVLPKRPEKEFTLKIPALTTGTPAYKPPANHPWRRPFLMNKTNLQTAH